MSIFLVSMIAGAVKAASIIDTIKDSVTLKYLTVDFVAGLKKAPPDAGAVVVAKILFGILIIIVINALLAMTPTISEWNKNARVGMAIIISLIATIAIPNEYLIKVIVGAGYVLIIIPLILLTMVGYYGMFKWFPGEERTDYVWKLIFAGFGAYLLGTIAALLEGVGADMAFGLMGLVSSILSLLVTFNWFYMIYAIYSIITGPAGTEGSIAKAAEKLPTAIGRPLRRLGRAAYRAERVSKQEYDTISDYRDQLEAIDLTPIDVGAAGKDDMEETFRRVLDPLRNKFNQEKIERIKERTENLTVDIYTWAKKIKDKKLITDAEGTEVLAGDMGKFFDEGEKNFAKLHELIGKQVLADNGFHNNGQKNKALDLQNDAVEAYESGLELLDKIKKLEEDIITKAGTQNIELHP